MGYKDRASGGRRGLPGDFIAKPSYTGHVYRPAWDKVKYLPTVFRPMGPTNEAQTEFLPARVTAEELDFGDWITAFPVFSGGSAMKISILADVVDDQGCFVAREDLPRTPVEILLEAAKIGKNTHPHWLPLYVGKTNTAPRITDFASTQSFIQGALLEHNGKTMYDKPIAPCTLRLSWSAKGAIEEALEEVVPGREGSGGMDKFVYPDILSADNGKLLRMHSNSTGPASAAESSAGTNWGAATTKERDRKSSKETSYYVCSVIDGGALPRDAQGRIQPVVAGLGWQPWSKVLNFLTFDKQLSLICQAFEDFPDLLEFAFGDLGWLPSSFYERQSKKQEAEARRREMEAAALAARSGKPVSHLRPDGQADEASETTAPTTPAPAARGPAIQWGQAGARTKEADAEGPAEVKDFTPPVSVNEFESDIDDETDRAFEELKRRRAQASVRE